VIPSPALAAADRLVLIVADLHEAASVRAAAAGPLAALLALVASWLDRLFGRFARITARLHAGKIPAPRSRAETVQRTQPARTAETAPLRRADRLPANARWLALLLGPQAAAFQAELCSLLSDRATVASLLEAAPHYARLLRPLCRAFGIPLVPALRRPRPKREPVAPPPEAQLRPPEPQPPPLANPAVPSFTQTVEEPMHARVARYLTRQRSGRPNWGIT
jgi:hypothetical protein